MGKSTITCLKAKENLGSLSMDLGLQLNSGGGGNVTETHEVQRVVVKEEYIKEEEYEQMIAFHEDEEKPFIEHTCKTETDGEFNVTYNETQQTTAEVEVKIEDDEQERDYLLESVSEDQTITQHRIHGQNDEHNLQLRGRLHHCTVCRKSFTALRELENHQQTHSVSVKEQQDTRSKITHICTHCGKPFGTYTQLKRHGLTHTGVKPHKCVQCGRAFSQMSNLNTHMLTHTGAKAHKCSHCEKSFSRSTHLKNHMRTHAGETPHECLQCGKSFPEMSHLQTHTLTHTEQKPHKCEVWKSFFTNFYS
ncbi:zinc finger protein 92-like isoform X4 [Sardina pilchardus]|uniref:zinc finger protein 92-like isoform X4 n=1 Tax=Sardina pilchardus TaxID=27697 RepID=UPI002E13767D